MWHNLKFEKGTKIRYKIWLIIWTNKLKFVWQTQILIMWASKHKKNRKVYYTKISFCKRFIRVFLIWALFLTKNMISPFQKQFFCNFIWRELICVKTWSGSGSDNFEENWSQLFVWLEKRRMKLFKLFSLWAIQIIRDT